MAKSLLRSPKRHALQRIIQKNTSLEPALQWNAHLSPSRRYLTSELYPRLSRQQVTYYLRYHEYNSEELNDGAVKYFMTNKLAANHPIEDRAAEIRLKIHPDAPTSQYLFGMFDGHAGCACAQVVSERLFSYIAVMLSPVEKLEKIKLGEIDPCNDLTYRFTHKDNYYSSDMVELYRKSLQRLASELLNAPNDDCTVDDILKAAFMRLDHDILADAIPDIGHSSVNLETISLALSGTCATLAYIDESDLYVANTGDCKAIIGQQLEEDSWAAIPLSKEHIAENSDEVERLNNQHPNERNQILRNGRLLGDLAPLRAFGDARYKWPARVMKHVLNISNPNVISIYGENLIPSNYKSPPYLTAEPEVMHHALSPRDKFLILATDGLAEHLDEQQIVDLVAGHMDERQILTEFVLPRHDITLGEVNEILKVRKRKLAKKPEDENVATHLLRMALGPAHGQISQYLTLPESIVRGYRDDITITVVYFDTDYLAKKATK
ncbi:[Pyruvate dehydrogenase [acetyl-transferring]]-phosphatase 1 [Mactra antiquata]